MGEALSNTDRPFSARELAAVVVTRARAGHLHAGLLYGRSDEVHSLDLGWEDKLRHDEGWDGEYLWACPEVEPERLRSVAATCRRVWTRFEKEKEFPYALKFLGTSFDREGALVLGPGARGLTCATFVLAIFKTVGIRLVKEDTWPVRTDDDLEFVASIRAFASKTVYQRLRAEVEAGAKRIRPDEVLGACAWTPPASFQQSRTTADRIFEQLG